MQKYCKASAVLAVFAGAAPVLAYTEIHAYKRPKHTSILTGKQWIEERMCGALQRMLSLSAAGRPYSMMIGSTKG